MDLATTLATPNDVHYTRRKTLHKLNQMNGDLLANLKKPLCSEVSRDVQGQNAGCKALCQKQVDLAFKEQSITIEKMKRSQDVVYQKFLKRNKERKRLQREIYKKTQEALRWHNFEEQARELPEPRKGRGDDTGVEWGSCAALSSSAPLKNDETLNTLQESYNAREMAKQINSDVNVGSGGQERGGTLHDKTHSNVCRTPNASDNNTHIQELCVSSSDDLLVTSAGQAQSNGQNKTKELKSWVVEVRKEYTDVPRTKERTSDQPFTAARSKLCMPVTTGDVHSECPEQNPHIFSHITSVFLGQERKVVPKTIDEEDATSNLEGAQKVRVRRHGSVKPPPSMLPPRKEGGASMPNKREKVPSVSECLQVRKTPKTGVNSVSEPMRVNRPKITQVEMNKKMAREREQKQREWLAGWPINKYVHNRNGQLVLSMIPFRRQDFSPPSQKERYFQRKMLLAQAEAGQQQRDRMEMFFLKIDEEGNYFQTETKLSPSMRRSIPSVFTTLFYYCRT